MPSSGGIGGGGILVVATGEENVFIIRSQCVCATALAQSISRANVAAVPDPSMLVAHWESPFRPLLHIAEGLLRPISALQLFNLGRADRTSGWFLRALVHVPHPVPRIPHRLQESAPTTTRGNGALSVQSLS